MCCCMVWAVVVQAAHTATIALPMLAADGGLTGLGRSERRDRVAISPSGAVPVDTTATAVSPARRFRWDGRTLEEGR